MLISAAVGLRHVPLLIGLVLAGVLQVRSGNTVYVASTGDGSVLRLSYPGMELVSLTPTLHDCIAAWAQVQDCTWVGWQPIHFVMCIYISSSYQVGILLTVSSTQGTPQLQSH